MTRYEVTEALADGTTQTACGPFAVGTVFTVDFPPAENVGRQATGLTTHAPPVGLPTEYAWYPLNEAHIAGWLERGAIRWVDDADGAADAPTETPAQVRMRHAREAKAAKAAGESAA